eukprot:NODE_393_length_2304_cov_132.810289_g364_i0.p1 GENE.NODE_393_length_2304_cov_132.810289_g364_i0~~NODE_393_length_2304_cov_132.810289_g364_i0.p1  ORF type:complete len:680 (+),score=185.19 NODE_393_length_2304_cov_132.810289_g364_i0:81-2120(+)
MNGESGASRRGPIPRLSQSRSSGEFHFSAPSTPVLMNGPPAFDPISPVSGSTKDGRPQTPRVTLAPSSSKGKVASSRRAASRASNRVQVAVRIRPISRYDGANPEGVLSVDSGNTIAIGKPSSDCKRFTYDYVFEEGQEVVYDCIGKPMLADAFEGYNVCLFAYGQTGSGKTYSIQGEPGTSEGIIPRFCHDMFAVAQEKLEDDANLTIKISMSYIEIYNEKVRDLLEKRRKGVTELQSLEIHETPDRKVYVEGLSIHTVINYERIKKLIEQGNQQRQTSETKMNEMSSRSHSIIQLYLSQTHDPPTPEKRDIESVLTLVDLAGSERQSKTEATGQQFDESKNINRSLLMLGRALNSFSDGSKHHVPLRESKLTRLLSECFGGNARTWMLACVSPSSYNYSETMSTLEYAQNAKAIINKAKVNSIQQRLELKELREQHSKLTILYENEKERSKQKHLELLARAEEIETLRKENELLRSRLEDVEVTKLQVESDLSTARGEMRELLRLNSEIQSVPRKLREGVQMYIGRAKVSLKNIIEQTSNYLTLPLISDIVEHESTQPQLIVNIYPVDSKGCSTLDNIKTKNGPKELLGHRVDFVVHIISAKNIPAAFSHCVYCKYVYKWAEKDSYKTNDVADCSDPDFDFKKRFAFSKMNQGLVDYFMSDNVITFEVIGEAKLPEL